MSIDLHCHTLFSCDSYGTPEELLDAAADNGVTALAITEHNHLGSAERGAERARHHVIHFFAGIELDAVYGERSYHFLGLGIDTSAPALHDLVEQNQTVYAMRFERYYQELLEKGFPDIRDELTKHLQIRYPTHPEPILTPRVVTHYVERHGGFPDFDAMHDPAMQKARTVPAGPRASGYFCQMTEARDAVHDAGGVFLLAHVGKYFPNDGDAQMALISRLMKAGMDGFELYHYCNYTHGNMDQLIRFAQDKGCRVSGGSDCGHAKNPSKTHVGKSRFGEPLAPEHIANGLTEFCRTLS